MVLQSYCKSGLAILASLLLLTACGSGEPGDDNVTFGYTGLTAPVVITEENAITIVNSGMNAQASAGEAGNSVPAAVTTQSRAGTALKAFLPDLFTRMQAQRQSFTAQEALLTGVAFTAQGDCGGSSTFNADADTGQMSVSYSNYCETDPLTSEKITLNGSMTLKDTTPENDLDAAGSISFNMFSIKGIADGESIDILMHGSMVATGTDDNISITHNLVAKDNIAGKQIKLENYVITMKYNYSADTPPVLQTVEVTENGKVFISDLGQIVIKTNQPVVIGQDMTPASGQIELIGANGTSIVLTFTGNNSYSMVVNGGSPQTGTLDELDIVYAIGDPQQA